MKSLKSITTLCAFVVAGVGACGCNRTTPQEHLLRGSAFQHADDHFNAIDEEVLRLSPDSGQALHQRELVWIEKKEFQRAVADFTRGIEQWPDSPLSFQHRVDAFEKLGEHEKSAAARKEAERLGTK